MPSPWETEDVTYSEASVKEGTEIIELAAELNDFWRMHRCRKQWKILAATIKFLQAHAMTAVNPRKANELLVSILADNPFLERKE